MRYSAFILFLPFLSSCSLLRPNTAQSGAGSVSMAQAIEQNRQPRKFLDDITVTPQTTRVTFVAQVDQQSGMGRGPAPVSGNTENSAITAASNRSEGINVSGLTGIQLKYAQLMNVNERSLPALSLLLALEEWYGTPYLWGGTSHRGIDCSAFTQAMYQSVYGVTLPRVSRDQHRVMERISMTNIREGDLVFFNTRGKGVSHVGLFLGNNKFVHASTKRGVTISDLYESYYIKRFLGAGRWKATSK
jgi:lipoprotein Spr